MISGYARTAALLSAMLLGALIPAAHAFAPAIRYLVMAMLFIVFLQTRVSRDAIHRSHLILLGTNIAVGLGAWGLGRAFASRDIALAAFFTGITPTAIAAPVIISFLQGRVEYVVASFVLTNISVAALLPFLLPVVLGRATPEAFGQVLGSVSLVVFAPTLAAWIVRRLHPPAMQWPGRIRTFSFGLWVVSLFLITSNASAFIRTEVTAPLRVVVEIGAISLAICAFNFGIGYLIGGRDFRREASQSLGQKNTTFAIYIALAYASPLVALGPTCYVLWHNLWNSWQLHRILHRPARDAAP